MEGIMKKILFKFSDCLLIILLTIIGVLLEAFILIKTSLGYKKEEITWMQFWRVNRYKHSWWLWNCIT